MEINITSNFLDVADAFKEVKTKLLYASTRHAINRTLITMRFQAIQQLRKQIDIKSSTLRNRHIRIHKAAGTSFDRLQGVISFNTTPVPLIEFVKGSKEPANQKGMAVKDRPRLKVQIRPGKKFTLKKAFIQKVKTKQVFSRASGQREFKKQAITSVGYIVMERGIGRNLADLGAQRFRVVFLADLRARINGHVGKIKDPPLR